MIFKEESTLKKHLCHDLSQHLEMFFLNTGDWWFRMPISRKRSVISAATLFNTSLMLIQGLCFSTLTVGFHCSSREGSILKCWVVLCRMISFSSLYLCSKLPILSSMMLVASLISFCITSNGMAATAF